MKPWTISMLLLLNVPALAACQDGNDDDMRSSAAAEADRSSGAAVLERATTPYSPPPLPGPSEEDAARAAWAYIERNEHATGLVGATEEYDVLTTWDLGSVLAAVYAARELGILGEEEYHRRMATILETLGEIDLFQSTAFNKTYSAVTGSMVDRRDRPSRLGHGWSVLDMGRVLAWLKVIEERDPENAAAARAVAGRFDYDRLIKEGYVVGGNLRSDGKIEIYQEGRIGYEQYAAEAFARWGHPAPASADLHRNAEPVEVLGQTIYVDRRGGDRVTSEPFIIIGLEFGWTDAMRRAAQGVLAAQRARYEQRGILTMVSEDSMAEAPYYFYYYCVYHDGRAFTIDAQGARRPLDGPRWLSAKAAYGWHALLPDDYTARVVETVAPAFADDRGWFSGVYEGSHERAGSMNVNTAALILEALLYRRTGRPLLDP